jgi:hypothetical protein
MFGVAILLACTLGLLLALHVDLFRESMVINLFMVNHRDLTF